MLHPYVNKELSSSTQSSCNCWLRNLQWQICIAHLEQCQSLEKSCLNSWKMAIQHCSIQGVHVRPSTVRYRVEQAYSIEQVYRLGSKVVTMLLWNVVHPTQWTLDSSLYWDCDVWFSRRGNRHLSDVVLLDIEGGNTQALLAWAVRVCKNGCAVRLHHYSYLKFWRRWDSWCMLSYPGSWSCWMWQFHSAA